MYSATEGLVGGEITVGGLETVHKVGNYLRKELHVGMSDGIVKRVLQKAGLKCKVKKKKPMLTLLQIRCQGHGNR